MAKKRQPAHGRGNETPDMDALAKAMRGIPAGKLRSILKRDRAFTFRLSEMDRETMEKASEAMGISVAEYLIRLHYTAYDALKEAGFIGQSNNGRNCLEDCGKESK